MKHRRTFRTTLCALALAGATFTTLYAFQRPFRQYPGVEYDNFPLPQNYREQTEWAFARLMYPSTRRGIGGGYGFRGNGDWREGFSIWTQDYPRADRHFSEAVRRLTRLHARSVEQPVNLDDGDDVYNWPWLYAVQVGQWKLTDAQAGKFREYLLRGGFFMCDDFWGQEQWLNFLESMQRVLPGRPVVDISEGDPVLGTVYNLHDRYQVPGARYRSTGVTWKCQGCPAHWRGIYDDQDDAAGERRSSEVAPPTGVEFTMTRDVWWSPSALTPISAIHGNGPTIRFTMKSFRHSGFASASTTSCMP